MNRRWLQIALGLALMGLLLWRARVWELGDTLRDFSIVTAIAVVLLNLPAVGLLAIRTHLVLRKLGYNVSPLSLVPISALGNVAAIVTPGASGDVIRAPFLKGNHAVSYSDSFATIAYERVYSFCLLCYATGLVVVWSVAPLPLRIVIPIVGVLALALPVLVALPLAALGKWADSTTTMRFWMKPFVRALKLGEGRWVQSLAALMKDLCLSLLFAPLTIAIFALVALQLWLIADSLSIHLSASEAFIAIGASIAAGIISFLPLGLGAFDWTVTALMERAGATVASATSVAILYRTTNSLPAGILGLLAYAYLVAKLGRVKSESSPSVAGSSSPDDGIREEDAREGLE